MTVIVGMQFGDEGKGKVVDFYARDADIVARYNGGSNAGHTVVIGTDEYKLHLLPSGVLREGKQVVLGNGVVVDPEVLIHEINTIQEKTGRKIDLKVSDRAHVVMHYHKELDELEEKAKGDLSAGTTKRGIGPCYSDKSSRFGIRTGDLLHGKALRRKLEVSIPMKEKLIRAHGTERSYGMDDTLAKYLAYGEKLAQYITDTSLLINGAADEGKNIILEGAQGTLLDIDHGVYPYGTSSNPVAGGACTGMGIGPTRINRVIGIAKAYTSRVGEGPFPTELKGEMGEKLRQKGGEFGTTTGRPRRCGWLDMVMLRHSVRVNSLTSVAVTKLDVMAGLPEIKVAKQYSHEGKIIRHFPSEIRILEECSPVYDQFDGWPDFTAEQWHANIKKGYDKFPDNLIKFIDYIEHECRVPVELISFGKERDLTLKITKEKSG